jgi:hypothetical protein
MTDQKKLKKAIRARSEKTGESYTVARFQLLAKRGKQAPPSEPAAPEPPPPAVAPVRVAQAENSEISAEVRGQVKEDVLLAKTGHGLVHWFAVLDAFGAAEQGHTAAAAHLVEVHGVPGWYAQGITGAWERARGLRVKNQSCSGTFQVSVSTTLPVPVDAVVAALADADQRAVWLAGADPALVQALTAALTGPKPKEVKRKGADAAGLRYRWDEATVQIYISAKPQGKTGVVADVSNLSDIGKVEERRAQWRTALAGLKRHLGG